MYLFYIYTLQPPSREDTYITYIWYDTAPHTAMFTRKYVYTAANTWRNTQTARSWDGHNLDTTNTQETLQHTLRYTATHTETAAPKLSPSRQHVHWIGSIFRPALSKIHQKSMSKEVYITTKKPI